ncbi:glycosyltransferase [Candidatus Woesearchaeota archaeon]|nr:MAG: glycosyltransferase [Candidatus Woesearchaeota archaeon]
MDEKPIADVVFECSWEVCNKVGGINTVLKSKAGLMKERYAEYFMVGPYVEKNAQVELDEAEPPSFLKKAFAECSARGIRCYFGSWLIKGEPKVVLIDASALLSQKDSIKAKLWEEFHIDSLHSRWEFEEPMLWSWAVGVLLEAVERELVGKKVVVHCHEWLAGFALLYLRSVRSSIASVFTTHATMLGRALAGSGYDLYAMLDSINPQEWAQKVGVQDKFSAERAMASQADVFSTVSEITALEAERILGRRPEVLLLNGLELERFPTFEETSIRHATNREIIREFLSYYFFPYYTFDVEHTLMFFFVGRYEFRNKGIDVLIDALAKLNKKLQEEGGDRHIVVFFWVPMGTRGVKQEIVENKNFFNHLKESVARRLEKLLQRLVYDLASSGSDGKLVLEKDFIQELKRDLMHFRRVGNPPMITHHIDNEQNDPLLNSLLSKGLDNKQDDRVKVVVYPAYLDGSDSLLNLPYYDAITGCHLGVFPSSYEPWGYTPLETAACGVPSVTTDLAGFGRFVMKKVHGEEGGIYVVPRYKHSYDEAVQELFEILLRFARLNRSERVHEKIKAKSLSALADWRQFVNFYVQAHNVALQRHQG